MKTRLKKCAIFTDIHFGRKNNSDVHNQDCIDYITWFCEQIKHDSTIDHIMFLGDWHEHRSAINGLTLKYSYNGAKQLNELGLPIYFCIGNHDLYFRNTREVFTTNIFESLNNFHLIDTPTIINNTVLKDNGVLICPYLSEDEYADLIQYSNIPIWYGHFEFKGFVVVGDYKVLDHGPDPDNFTAPKKIFSGHFHKRQSKNNIHYIGNTFPADYGDANDSDRGYATYDYALDTIEYVNWPECPTYIKANLSEILDSHKTIIKKNSRVKCIVDTDITYEESNVIREKLSSKYKLREFAMEESLSINDVLTETDSSIDDIKIESTSQVIKELLKRITIDKIKSDTLIKIYEDL